MCADDDIYTDRVKREREKEKRGMTHTSHPHIHVQKKMIGRHIQYAHNHTHTLTGERRERGELGKERKERERATHTYRRKQEKEERREPSDRGIEEIRERKRKETFTVLPRTCRLAQAPGTRLGVTARACQLGVTCQEGSGEFGSILVTAVS